LILSVGRLVEKKGFENLIKACHRLQEWGVKFKCEIIGSGLQREQLEQSIADLRLEKEVKVRGQMPHGELRQHYENAMVFALPCVVAANGDRDILPNVVKEAMAVGVPVVTTRLGGIEELVTDEETGLLARHGDVDALAGSLKRLLADADLRQRLVRKARKVIEERFNLTTNFTRLKCLLREAMEERASVKMEAQARCN